MMSYFLGVGTVVGALALGFGGGIVLTKTAIQETPAGPSRLERVTRPEPVAPPAQTIEAKAAAEPRVDQSSTQQAPAPLVQAATETPKPVGDNAKENGASPAEPVKQADAKQTEQPVKRADVKPVEPTIRQGEAKPVEQKAKPIEQKDAAARLAERRAEQRRIDQDRRIAERERKARAVIAAQRQRPVEEQERSARPQLAFQREEPGPNLFEGLFGRPAQGERE